jgi:hypothetical protein
MLFDVSFRGFSDTTICLQIKKTWLSFWQQNSSGKTMEEEAMGSNFVCSNSPVMVFSI